MRKSFLETLANTRPSRAARRIKAESRKGPVTTSTKQFLVGTNFEALCVVADVDGVIVVVDAVVKIIVAVFEASLIFV